MLELKNIVKDYKAGDMTVHALKDISIRFRDCEFVSVLGHSGCGKTTLLNIIGGLDHYTSGDLLINGVSTKTYKDKNWDAYRNHSIGFVFQSYNLIPHQTVLSNVELALTLSGVSKAERRKRAINVLERVGLGDQLNKKPSQMSGGQMQRVAIARALVNDPDILLADEPTGALDSATSVQIMELLAEIAKEKLVIMVTHNPELANTYSTRIVRLSDGEITDDSDPFTGDEQKEKGAGGKTSMSYLTALSLSVNNLLTKKARTLLTAFAGSIGIIGIALILSLSSGIQEYIDTVQENTLASYPITIQKQTMDMSSLMESMMGIDRDKSDHQDNMVYSNDLMGQMVNTMLSEIETNNLSEFKSFIEAENSEIKALAGNIKYTYDVTPYIFVADTSDGINQVNPNNVMTDLMAYSGYDMDNPAMQTYSQFGGGMSAYTYDSWKELIDNRQMLSTQYDLLAGHWPESMDEVVLIIDKNNEVSDLVLYSLGLKDKSQLPKVYEQMMKGERIYTESLSFTFDEILGLKFKMVIPTDFYEYDSEKNYYKNRSDDEEYLKSLIENGMELKMVGIIRPNEDVSLGSSGGSGSIGYISALTRHIMSKVNDSDVVKAQKADKTYDYLAGMKFNDGSLDNINAEKKAQLIKEYFSGLDNITKTSIYAKLATAPTQEELEALVEKYKLQYNDEESKKELMYSAMKTAMEKQGMQMEISEQMLDMYLKRMTQEQFDEAIDQIITEMANQEFRAKQEAASGDISSSEGAKYFDEMIAGMDTEQLAKLYDEYMPKTMSDASYDDIMFKLGVCDESSPSSISIYASTFAAKDEIANIIKRYNEKMETDGKHENVISYTDYVGLMMSSVSDIINTISYVLIAFVAISLVVSSIMIGIITYISVLERTKEIGILRAIGPSKRDISNVFNAEAITIGFVSGFMGIVITLLLNIPINMIIKSMTGIDNIAKLPAVGAVILVLISMALTYIAGLFPSRIAAKKDPVEALRTE